jgi:hypothetical protein
MAVETRPEVAEPGPIAPLFAAHIIRFNAGVSSGDFTDMISHFTDDATATFVSLPFGPFHGRAEIEQAYRDYPPDDTIDVLSTAEPDEGTIVARFAWHRTGQTGTIRLGHRGDDLTDLTVEFDPGAGGGHATSPAAEASRGFDAEVIRRDFPILDQEINGHRLVYLDSASTSQKPQVVLDAIDTYYREYNANVHRGIYTIGEKATAEYERARAKVARFINAPDAHEVVFTRNATEAINLVAYSWGRQNINHGDAIVLTEMEHHANLVPWQLLVQERDGDLEFIPITDDGVLRLEVFRSSSSSARSSSRSPTSRTPLARSTPFGRWSRWPTRPGRWSWSTARRPSRTCRSMSRSSAPTSTPSAATRCSPRWAPGPCGRAASSSRRCRRSCPAAR